MSARDIFRDNPIDCSPAAREAMAAKWRYKRELALPLPDLRTIAKSAQVHPPNPIGAQLWNLTSVKALGAGSLIAQAAPTSPAPYMPSRGAEIEDRMYLTQYEWNAGGLKRRLQ